MNIVWLPNALLTRDKLLDHIATDSIQAALDQGDRLENQIDSLSAHPEIGRPGHKRGTRELVISGTSCVVIYRVRPRLKRVEILRVLHSAQQWPQT